MNVNELNVHKSTLFLCLHNSFLKKLTLQHFSVAARAVPPEETGRGIFATMSSLSIPLLLSLSERANCDASPRLRITITLYVKDSFSSTCSTQSNLVVLAENWLNTKASAVIYWVSLVLFVPNKSSLFSLIFLNQIRLNKKLIFVSFFRYILFL